MYAPTLPAMTSNQNNYNSCETKLLYINIRIHKLQPFRNHYQQSTNSTTIYLPTRILGWLLFKNEFLLIILKFFFFAYLIDVFTIVLFKVHNNLSCLLNLMKTCFHSVLFWKPAKNMQCLFSKPDFDTKWMVSNMSCCIYDPIKGSPKWWKFIQWKSGFKCQRYSKDIIVVWSPKTFQRVKKRMEGTITDAHLWNNR